MLWFEYYESAFSNFSLAASRSWQEFEPICEWLAMQPPIVDENRSRLPPRVSPSYLDELSVPSIGRLSPPSGNLQDSASNVTDVQGLAMPRMKVERLAWYRWPSWGLSRLWEMLSLCVLLAIVSAIPIVQLASLGYLLNSAANLAKRRPWSSAFPGARVAGRIAGFALMAGLFWLPVWFVSDLSYSAQLLQPGSNSARAWRLAAFAITFAWVLQVVWAAMRGGRCWHFLWPAPIRFLKNIGRPCTWARAADDLFELTNGLQIPRLWWLGTRAAAGALLWTALPVSCMIIGQRASDFEAAALVGLAGAAAMTVIMLYLPFLQIQLAVENRFAAMFAVRAVRKRFLFAPWAHALSLLLLCGLCIPLYLLRIEATPAELVWAPSLVFVAFMLPAKIILGAAMGYADSRRSKPDAKVRHWVLRWPARSLALASVLVYVGALYVAQLVAGQGAFVMYFQHAFLVPAPLISS